jgi:hypothetical protein
MRFGLHLDFAMPNGKAPQIVSYKSLSENLASLSEQLARVGVT